MSAITVTITQGVIDKILGNDNKPKTKVFINVPGEVFARVFCPKCDLRIRTKDNFCVKCGIEFDWSD